MLALSRASYFILRIEKEKENVNKKRATGVFDQTNTLAIRQMSLVLHIRLVMHHQTTLTVFPTLRITMNLLQINKTTNEKISSSWQMQPIDTINISFAKT